MRRDPLADVDAVLLDVGGVLVLPDARVLAPLLAHYGGSEDLAVHARAHYAAMAAKSRAGASETEWRDYDVAYVEVVGVETADREEAAEVLRVTRTAHLWRWPIADSVAALGALHHTGVPIGIVSNAAGQVEAMLRRTSICQVGDGPGIAVHCVVDSHVVGVAKPDPAIFDHALAVLHGARRDHVVYVGDSLTIDVVGATAAGLVPVLLDPFDDHDGAEVTRVRSLSVLAAAIRERSTRGG